eukprot:TRINITY_DN3545_c0_g1_i1.p1 TRINITY_DN3545_c0_g1~~TRINITY_DN3545_c0_g1_i1.p1  ORF type:complete len:185 (-),score=53.99 TRINITY_DN3545_c0_g1_i1:512-1066(-)
MGCNASQEAKPVRAVSAVPEGDFKVTVENSEGQGLGLSIVWQEDNTFSVTGVKDDGLVFLWNKENENNPDYSDFVTDGAVIVAVNGVFGDCDSMMKAMKDKTITLIMKRTVTRAVKVEAAVAAETDEPAAEEPAAVPEPVSAEPASEPSVEAPTKVPPAIVSKHPDWYLAPLVATRPAAAPAAA